MTRKTWQVVISIAIAITLSIALFVSCTGNANLSEGLTNESNTFRYVLSREAEHYRLHEVEKWMDSASDALGVRTKCCHNTLWASYNVAVLYRELPNYLSEDVEICDGR